MKVLICTDIEGVAGVTSFEQEAYPTGKYYEDAKRLLTGEVNAATAGLVEAGITDILVWDGHGAGGIRYEDLKAPARLLHGRPLGARRHRDDIARQYDVCMMLGQHAMAGTETGNLNHTQSSLRIDYIRLNGKPVGEIAQFALYQGAFGTPLIFLSGDDAACREAEALVPGIVTVAVKQSLGRGEAISLPREEAHARIREGIKKAVARHREQPLEPVVWPGPYVLEKRFFHTHHADAAENAGAERVDSQTVRFQGNDIQEIIYR